MTTLRWIRARPLMGGEEWFSYERGRCSPGASPSAIVESTTLLLDQSLPSVALARDDEQWIVCATGFRTAQQTTNTPNPIAGFVFAGEEQPCRQLAARMLLDLLGLPPDSLAGRLAAAVIDGETTKTIGLSPEFALITREASAEPVVDQATTAELPPGRSPRNAENIRRLAALLMADTPLPDDEVALAATGEFRDHARGDRRIGFLLSGDDLTAQTALPAPTTATPRHDPTHTDSVTIPRLGRRLVGAGRIVDLLCLVTLALVISTFVIVVRAFISLAATARSAVGGAPPRSGVDWYLVVIFVLAAAVTLGVLFMLRQAIRRRRDAKLIQHFGSTTSTPFSTRSRFQRRDWAQRLETAPYWSRRLQQWRATGAIDAPLSDDRGYKQAAELVRMELSRRVAARALAAGLAVAVARRRLADVIAVLAASVEIQTDTLAVLGLRPRPAAWLQVSRAAALGTLASAYVDAEERYAVRLVMRGAAFGLDTAADALDEVGDFLDDDVAEAAAELFDSAGSVVGGITTIGGAALGVTATAARRVSDFAAAVGDEVAEGVLIAAVLHYYGSKLIADILALDGQHHEVLAPGPLALPDEILTAGKELARRETLAFRRLVRARTRAAMTKLPGLRKATRRTPS